MTHRAVFLDRDGILNRAIVYGGKPYPPARLEDVEILSGTVSSLNKLQGNGYILIGITNQPDIARGTQTIDVVKSINAYIELIFQIREIFVCYHDDQDDCACRKPKPGLILQAAKKYDLDLSQSWMVGDRWKDVSAGKSAGLTTIFVDYRYNEVYKGPTPDYTIENPELLAEIILRKKNETTK